MCLGKDGGRCGEQEGGGGDGGQEGGGSDVGDRKKTGVMRRTGSTECILKWLWKASQEPGPGSWQATRALDLLFLFLETDFLYCACWNPVCKPG